MQSKSKAKWDTVKHTDAKSQVVSFRKAVDVMAVTVKKASIRHAVVSGTFEVADVANPFTLVNGVLKVEVKCHWHGLPPAVKWMHLTIPNKYQFMRRYTGEVVDDIGV